MAYREPSDSQTLVPYINRRASRHGPYTLPPEFSPKTYSTEVLCPQHTPDIGVLCPQHRHLAQAAHLPSSGTAAMLQPLGAGVGQQLRVAVNVEGLAHTQGRALELLHEFLRRLFHGRQRAPQLLG